MDDYYQGVLEALAIPEKMREQMLISQSMEQKWLLIQQHQNLLQDDEVSDAGEWAEMLLKETKYPKYGNTVFTYFPDDVWPTIT